MTWTQQQYLDAVKEALDAAGSSRWGDLAVRNALTVIHRREWRRILRAFPTYRFKVMTLDTDAAGQIALTALTTGAADTKQRFFQVLGRRIYVGNQRYELTEPLEQAFALGQPSRFTAAYLWYRADTYVQLLPAQATSQVVLPINHLPTAIGSLSAGGVAAEYPEDYELIVAYGAAALLYAKGDAEVKGTGDFATLADALRDELLAELGHITPDDAVVRAGDDATEWGG